MTYHWTEMYGMVEIQIRILTVLKFTCQYQQKNVDQTKLFRVAAHTCTDPRTLAHTRTRSAHTRISKLARGGCVAVQQRSKNRNGAKKTEMWGFHCLARLYLRGKDYVVTRQIPRL